jgi:glutathione synthase/RimK-type ligase-like ATP-grasp enzyme
MNYIIVGKYGIPSIKSIYNNLENIFIIKCFDGQWKRLLKRERDQKFIWLSINNFIITTNDRFLRFGCTSPLIFNGAKIYNKSKSIDLASNKYLARLKMQENNIPIPKTSLSYRDFFDLDSNSYKIVIARPFKHSKGKDFHILKNNQEYNHFTLTPSNYYYSELYNKQREVRVHIAHGKILSIQEKPLVEGIIQANQAITHESWRVIPWGEYEKDICYIACKAVQSIGLDCGAVDLMIDRRNNLMPLCVCEINTCPSLDSSPYDQKRYSKYFNWLFRHEREWFNFEIWTQGKSFSFKNDQLDNS